MSKLDIAKEVNKRVTERNLRPYYTKITAPPNVYQIDLADFSLVKQYNKNHTFAFIIIEIYSRKAWVYPIKKKTPIQVTLALNKFIKEVGPKNVDMFTADFGNEFKGVFSKILDKHGINISRTLHKNSQAIVERFIRTFREEMRDIWTRNDNFNWIDHIDDVLKIYNNRKHRGINAIPNEVYNGEDEPHQFDDPDDWQEHTDDLKAGTPVRILIKAEMFDKKSLKQNYTRNVYEVEEKFGNMYKIKGLKQRYARWQLLKSNFPINTKPEKELNDKLKKIKRKKKIKQILKAEDIIKANQLPTRTRGKRIDYKALLKGNGNKPFLGTIYKISGEYKGLPVAYIGCTSQKFAQRKAEHNYNFRTHRTSAKLYNQMKNKTWEILKQKRYNNLDELLNEEKAVIQAEHNKLLNQKLL